jgi:6-phosphogluconolactonase
MTMTAFELVRIYPDAEALSQAAAGLFVEQARRAAEEHGRFAVALAGGNTPRRTYELLARPPFSRQVPWAQCHFFFGDERCVPPDDPRSNARMAKEALLDHVPVPPDQIYPILCNEEPGQAAERYEGLMRRFFGGAPPRFDLIFLGLGENGHTASLFPKTPVLAETRRWAAEVYVAEGNLFRVTLTAPVINQGETVAFLVSGREKAEVFRRLMKGAAETESLPASLIRPESGELLWLADREANALAHAGGNPE